MLSRGISLATLLASLLLSSAFASSAEKDLSLTVVVGKGAFKTGEPVPIELRVHYEGKESVILSFPTAQRYDFQIEEPGGGILWRWSDGRMFAQTLGQLVLSPDRPEIRYQAVFQDHLPPGCYAVRGLLTTRPQPFSAVAEITIR